MQPETLIILMVCVLSFAAIRIIIMMVQRSNDHETAHTAVKTEAAEPAEVQHFHAHRGTGRQRHLMILDEPVPGITAPKTQ